MSPSTSPEDIHQRAAILVAMLIDSNYIHHSYLEVLEIVSNDSNVIIVSDPQILLRLVLTSYLLEC